MSIASDLVEIKESLSGILTACNTALTGKGGTAADDLSEVSTQIAALPSGGGGISVTPTAQSLSATYTGSGTVVGFVALCQTVSAGKAHAVLVMNNGVQHMACSLSYCDSQSVPTVTTSSDNIRGSVSGNTWSATITSLAAQTFVFDTSKTYTVYFITT